MVGHLAAQRRRSGQRPRDARLLQGAEPCSQDVRAGSGERKRSGWPRWMLVAGSVCGAPAPLPEGCPCGLRTMPRNGRGGGGDTVGCGVLGGRVPRRGALAARLAAPRQVSAILAKSRAMSACFPRSRSPMHAHQRAQGTRLCAQSAYSATSTRVAKLCKTHVPWRRMHGAMGSLRARSFGQQLPESGEV